MYTSLPKTEDEWKEKLTPEQYVVLRKKGTEIPFIGKYYKTNEKGMYVCAACDNELFSSDSKIDSISGWPHFSKPSTESALETEVDTSYGMVRTEVHCNRCGSHLGHVFDDKEESDEKKYCINSLSLDLKK